MFVLMRKIALLHGKTNLIKANWRTGEQAAVLYSVHFAHSGLSLCYFSVSPGKAPLAANRLPAMHSLVAVH